MELLRKKDNPQYKVGTSWDKHTDGTCNVCLLSFSSNASKVQENISFSLPYILLHFYNLEH
jgi:hypothetical protein